jgi:hypothetical protein
MIFYDKKIDKLVLLYRGSHCDIWYKGTFYYDYYYPNSTDLEFIGYL